VKATQKQYDECVELYDKRGPNAVYEYAERHGIDEWSYCEPCESNTPDTEDECCLVCGSYKHSTTE
jgi:hypothetical protein